MAGGERGVALGWDMAGALALGRALGIPARLLGELLPPIEAAVMAALNAPGAHLDFTEGAAHE